MSILIFMFVAPIAATLDDFITWRFRAVKMARKCPRARRFTFN